MLKNLISLFVRNDSRDFEFFNGDWLAVSLPTNLHPMLPHESFRVANRSILPIILSLFILPTRWKSSGSGWIFL